MINLAGMLAGILLTATVGGDAGMVALAAGRSIAQNEILRFSRARESEADRIGINTLIESGNDPRAMAYMFERLDQASRFAGDDLPDFLRTHPVTRKRISDSYNQVQNEPEKDYELDLDYQFMRHRVIVQTSGSDVQARQKMLDLTDSPDPVIQDAARYGLVLALSDTGEFDRAMRELAMLQDKYPDKISLTEAEADIHIRAKRPFRAIEILEDALSLSPNNYPLTVAYAKALVSDGRPADAEVILEPLTQERPNDAGMWYLLAEIRGLADNILGVHEARAEYFVLVGNLDQAIKQLGFAIPMVRDNFQRVSRIRSRIDEISRLRDRGKKRG
jgi:predicted Zn-dependent protease